MFNYFSPAAQQGCGRGGVWSMVTSQTGPGDAIGLITNNWITQARWRAGNLGNRGSNGGWMKSMHSPLDNIRPMRVQNIIVVDGDELSPVPACANSCPNEFQATVWR